jgi:YbbR domain-containing protein
MKDKYLLIISAFIAVAIWIYVFASENREISIQVPINLIETREGTMATVSPREVSVRVKGPRSLIYNAIDSNTAIDMNVSERPVEISTIRLSPNDIRITGVEIMEITPSQLELTVRDTQTATIRFQPLILGQPKRGYRVAATKVIPETAEVEGFAEYLEMINTIQTKNINIEGIEQSTTYSAEPAEYNGVKTITPDNVSIVVEIMENIQEQRFMTRVVCADGTGTRALESSLPLVEVTVRGRIDILDAIETSNRLVETNCGTLDSPIDTHLTGSRHIILPLLFDDYEIIRIHPNSVEDAEAAFGL